MILRRRRPGELDAQARAFDELVPVLERAKAALTGAVPGTRVPGRPLAEALLGFEEGLREVREGMAAWRAPEIEDAWQVASAGLDEARSLAERVRSRGTQPEGFEGLVGLIGDLLAPLDGFHAAGERFRRTRT